MRLSCIAEQQIDLRRPKISRVNSDQYGASLAIDTSFLDGMPSPLDLAAYTIERQLDDFAYCVRLACRQHIVVGLILLHHQPHTFDIIASMSPIASRVEISQINTVLKAVRY